MSKGKIVVVGAGGWGSWSAFMLQQAGYLVTLVDQYGPGNERSGSGGKTRVIRMAYGGDPDYTRMTHRSFQLWQEYEKQWSDKLYHETGALWLFGDMSPLYATKSKPMMEALGYPLEKISLQEVSEQYPQINLDGITQCYWEPVSGYLEASRACKVVVQQFEAMGGTFLNEKITGLNGIGEIESLNTDSGMPLTADQYVFACGPWVNSLFPELNDLIYASRQEVYYYRSPEKHLAPDLPIWIEFQPPTLGYYGIPDHFGRGFKVAYDERNVPIDPDRDSREVTPAIFEEATGVATNRFPALKDAKLIEHKICVYENSKDGEFIMDQTPGYSNGIILGGSSGHGYKMSPAIGEMVKDLIDREQAFPNAFRLERLYSQTRVRNQYEVE